jgi:hypothetical protein
MTKIGSKATSAVGFIQDIILKKATSHRVSHPGGPVILAGDLNMDIQAMTTWMRMHSWFSPPHSIVQDIPSFNTFWGYGDPPYNEWTGISWIDHILVYDPSNLKGTAVSLGTGPRWALISDHRPISLWVTGEDFKIASSMSQTPQQLPPRLIKKSFQSKDAATMTKYRASITRAVQDLPQMDNSPEAAGNRLKEIAALSVASVPNVAPSQVSPRTYKGGWSPILMALDAKLLGLTNMIHRLRGVGKGSWWRSREAQRQGILDMVTNWTTAVHKLKWPGDIPAEVWVGHSPEEWRLAAEEDSESILRKCSSDLRLLKQAFQGRRRLEYRRQISYAVRLREYMRSIGKLKKAIKSITGTYIESISLEEIVARETWAENQPPPGKAELQRIVTDIMEQPHRMPEEQKEQPGIHDGAVQWADILDYGAFRQLYQDWKLPSSHLVEQDGILLKIHHALTNVKNRDKVFDELSEGILRTPPSYETFRHSVCHHAGDTAGGMQGLTFAMMKAWPEEVMKQVYDLLCSLWVERMVPMWWQYRWLIPIPKRPETPSLQELRPIVLLEVMRKCWTGLIVAAIMEAIERHEELAEGQHGFRKNRGTHTANLQLKNAMETAWQHKKKIYGSSWDISKAFDSVSRPLIRLAWDRVGVPPPIVDWLMELDHWAMEIWEE